MKRASAPPPSSPGPKFPLTQYTLTTEWGASSVTGPYLLPIGLRQTTPYTLVLLIPNVAGADAGPSTCAIPPSDNPDFSLSWQVVGPEAIAVVTVAPDRVFSSDPADRAALMRSFAEFSAALDTLERQRALSCIAPGGAAIIANRIAASLPLRLDELLYFYYGFDAARRCVNLVPGMCLSVGPGAYQFVAPTSSPLSAANAFATRGQVRYRIGRKDDQTLSFDSYIGGLRPYSICPSGAPLAGVIDLCSTCNQGSTETSYARRHYRLIYPNQENGPTSIGSNPGISRNPTLLGADSLAELDLATKVYVESKTCARAAENSVVCLCFDGRFSVVPEIPIVVEGATRLVPVGTTLQDALDTLLRLAPDPIGWQLQTNALTLQRYSYDALLSSSSYSQSKPAFQKTTIYVPRTGSARSTQYDLPLIQADVIALDPPKRNERSVVTTRPLTDPDSPTLVGPYLMPPGFVQGPQPPSLVLTIADVAGPNAAPDACGIPAGTNPDFSLAWTKQGHELIAEVTVQTANLVSGDPAARAEFRRSFAELRRSLEALELEGGCLIPGGAAVVAHQIAGSLPLAYGEMLQFHYGFDPELRAIDLQPGMRLRVESGAYQFVAPAGAPGSTESGYTSQGIIAYGVVRDASQRLTFSPFLRDIAPVQVSGSGAPMAGVVDLAERASVRRYYRLVYPSSFSPANVVDPKTPPAAQNVVLIGADALADLDAATRAYVGGEPLPVTTPPIVCRYFTGRAGVTPEIAVSVQGALEWVPIGTTMRAILERYAVLAQDDIYGFVTRTPNTGMRRYATPSLPGPASGKFGAGFVEFDEQTSYVPVPGSDRALTQWDIPLVMSDVVEWPWSVGK